MTAQLHLTRSPGQYPFAVAADGWLRREGGQNKGTGLMLRRVELTQLVEMNWMHKVKIWYCPSADDTGTLVETSLGMIEGTFDDAIALRDYINTNAGKWMP